MTPPRRLLLFVVIVPILVFLLYLLWARTAHGVIGAFLTGRYAVRAKELERTVRVLCWIPTSKRNFATKAAAVRDTWAPRCNKHIFFSSDTDMNLKTVRLDVSEGIDSLITKTLKALEYIHEHYIDEYDWFLKADDDTYVIVDNLRLLLSNFEPSESVYLGHHFKAHADQGYMSGGAGYVLSRKALQKLVTFGIRRNLCRRWGGAEDAGLGKCLEKVGVKPANSMDTFQRDSFHPFNLKTHIFGTYPEWYYTYHSKDTVKQGRECCSEFSISYHFVDHMEMRVIDHLLYYTQIYGRRQLPLARKVFKGTS